MGAEEIIAALRDNKANIEKYGVERIGLFGSYSRSEQSDGSDVDILVRFEKGCKTFDNYMDLKFYLEDLLGKKVDLVITENIKIELKDEILGSVKYA
ncbi:MAG: Nucleotidyltransferase [Firmicutes bacterium]|nr:Nucleotidyltransferase [Bacillota bacterium]